MTLERDRRLVLAALVALAALAWAYTVRLGVEHGSMADAMSRPSMIRWSAADFVFMFVMWAVMMFAMMLPSVTPTVMIFARVREKREAAGRPFAPTGAFVSGYLLAWVGFSLLATVANWGLARRRRHVVDDGQRRSGHGRCPARRGGGIPMDGAQERLPQPLPLADELPYALLARRKLGRGPDGIAPRRLLSRLLLVLLFVLGVMNLPWVAVLTIVVLAEKTLPRGESVSRGLGLLLVAWGGWLMAVA